MSANYTSPTRRETTKNHGKRLRKARQKDSEIKAP